MENKIEENLKEWKKCYSKSRKRDYYFNARTNKSLWTLEEVKNLIQEEINKNAINQDDSGASTHQSDQAWGFPFVLFNF